MIKRDARCLAVWGSEAIPKDSGFMVGSRHERRGCWMVQVRYDSPLNEMEVQVRSYHWNHFPYKREVQNAVARMVLGVGVLLGMNKSIK